MKTKLNEPFKETFPRVAKTVVPGNIPLPEWQNGEWIKIDRKPIREQLKEISNHDKHINT